jgi:hypothetical protein
VQKLITRLARVRSQRGFSLVELMVGGMVLVVGLIMLSQFFASAAARVMESDIRSVLHQVATEELEIIRGLPYTDVGTTSGHPQGVLVADEDRTVDITKVHIHRSVVYWTDPSYETGGPYPANYRRVTVKVSAVGQSALDPVELVSNLAGGTTGGTILVKVQDSQGLPVEGANFTIVDDHLVPPVSITSSDMVTNDLGIMLVPGLKVDDSGNYVVEATKSGYSTDSKTEFGVMEGTSTEVVLTIDKLSAMVIRVVDSGTGADVAGVNLSITGPQTPLETVVSAAGGVVRDKLRFSTSDNPYVVTLLPNQGYASEQQSVALPADSTLEVVFYVTAGSGTTTTTAGSGTTTTVAPTTTTVGTGGSLQVTVISSATHNPLKNAWVNLEGQTRKSGWDGIVTFQGLELRAYDIDVTKNDYAVYSGTVTITGATTVTIELTYDGLGPHPR